MTKSSAPSRLPGFRDFPPAELALRSHIIEGWRRVARRYGFEEYDAPPLEPLELYTQKSGDEIVAQLYDFQDKGGRPVALRPEMTPSLARILCERSRSLPKPIRWFSVPQLFRYERQQRGRLREHIQWNVDLVGESGVEAEAEVLSVALDGLRSFGLDHTEIRARVSDRVLLAEVLSAAGVPADRMVAAFSVIDKVERDSGARTRERLEVEASLEAEGAERILSLLGEPGLDAVERTFGGSLAVADRLRELRRFLEIMSELGFEDFVEFDLRIVRGLAYYTGIVFEVFDRRGEFRAICGGGRYDQLLDRFGGEPLPAIGFGMGDVVLGELLRDRGLLPEHRRSVDLYIVAVRDELLPLARRMARRAREGGRSVLYPLRPLSVKKQFAQAAAEGARQVLILGPDEVVRGVAKLRSMEDGVETEVSIEAWEATGGGGGG